MEDVGQERSEPGSGDEIERMYDELAGNSERAIAVLAQAMLEKDIRWLISLTMRKGNHTTKLLGDDESPGVLSFSDQCRLTYCLGLIDHDALSDLLTIARIRNRFGHSRMPLTFESTKIKDRCFSLRNIYPDEGLKLDWLFGPGGKDSPRGRYIRCVEHLLGMICFESSYRAETMFKSLNPIAPDSQAHPQESPPSTEPQGKGPAIPPELL